MQRIYIIYFHIQIVDRILDVKRTHLIQTSQLPEKRSVCIVQDGRFGISGMRQGCSRLRRRLPGEYSWEVSSNPGCWRIFMTGGFQPTLLKNICDRWVPTSHAADEYLWQTSFNPKAAEEYLWQVGSTPTPYVAWEYLWQVGSKPPMMLKNIFDGWVPPPMLMKNICDRWVSPHHPYVAWEYLWQVSFTPPPLCCLRIFVTGGFQTPHNAEEYFWQVSSTTTPTPTLLKNICGRWVSIHVAGDYLR
jgi:hypothetical protein